MRQKNAILNIIVGIIFFICHLVTNFIITSIILKTFGSETNGLVNSIKQLLSYLALIEGGLGAACIMSYYPAIANKDYLQIAKIYYASELFYRKIGLLFLALLVIIGCTYPFIIKSEISNITIMSVIFITGLFTCLQFLFLEKYQSIIIANQKNRVVQIITCFGEIVQVLAVYIVINCFNYKNILCIQSIYTSTIIIRILICFLYFKKNYNFIIKEKNNVIISKNYEGSIKQRNASLIHVIAQQISFSTDIVILTIFKNLSDVSIYSIYNLLLTTSNYVFGILSNAVSSSFGNLFYSEKNKVIEKFNVFEFFTLLISTIISSLLVIIIKPFINIYVNINDSVKYWNVTYAILFIAISFLNNLRTPHAMMIKVSGNFEKTKYIFLGEAFINLILSLCLVKNYGIIGVLIGTLFSSIFRDIFVIAFIYKEVINKSFWNYIKIFIINTIVLLFFVFISFMYSPNLNSYIELLFFSLINLLFCILFTLLINYIFCRNLVKTCFLQIVKSIKVI